MAMSDFLKKEDFVYQKGKKTETFIQLLTKSIIFKIFKKPYNMLQVKPGLDIWHAKFQVDPSILANI